MYRTVVSTRSCLPWIEHNRKPDRDQIYHGHTNSSMIQLLSGDGFSVSLPTPLVLANSPLIQSVLSQHHHCGTVSISLPSAEGSILILIAEILRRGETSALCGNKNSCQKLRSVQGVLDMLQCSVKITQNSLAGAGTEDAAGNPYKAASPLDTDQSPSHDLPSSTPTPTDFTVFTTNSSSKHSSSKSEESSVLSPGEISIKLELEEEGTFEESKVLVIDARLEDILFSPKGSSGHESLPSLNDKNEKVGEVINLSCPFCKRVVKSQKSLKQHMMIRHPEPVHACVKCDSSYPSKKELGKHMKSAHFKFQCKSCHLTFKTKLRLHTHLEAGHLHKPTFEEKNMIGPRSKNKLIDQFKWEHDDARFYCGTCLKIFRTNKSFMKHCNILNHDPNLMTSFKMPRYKKSI